jgi:hypothetical protein
MGIGFYGTTASLAKNGLAGDEDGMSRADRLEQSLMPGNKKRKKRKERQDAKRQAREAAQEAAATQREMLRDAQNKMDNMKPTALPTDNDAAAMAAELMERKRIETAGATLLTGRKGAEGSAKTRRSSGMM